MQKGSVFHSKSIVWSGTKAAHTKMYLYICSLIVLLSAKNLLHATQGANTNLDEAHEGRHAGAAGHDHDARDPVRHLHGG